MSEGLVLNGRFRLIEVLGRGGMGSVWRAADLELEADAAVKLIDPSLLQTPEALARFKREAKAAASIRSTHVVQILEYGVQQTDAEEAQPYIAMELLKGESLAKRIERSGRMTPEQTLSILTHVARALSLAHKNGIVHRDLKPDNIFLVREMDDDVGKVLDFGVARQLSALGKTGGMQTQSGAVLGTPYYMSPEQTVGQPVDARSDIWSFGVIAYECLTGVRPFEQESLGGLFHAICVAAMPVPSTRCEVPKGFDEWFARATARDINARFQTIGEVIADLRKNCGRAGSVRPLSASSLMQSGVATPARSATFGVTPPPAAQTIPGLPPPRPWLAFALVLPVVALVGAGGYFGWHWVHTSNSPATPSLSPSQPSAPPTLNTVVAPSLPSSQPQVAPVPVLQEPALPKLAAKPGSAPAAPTPAPATRSGVPRVQTTASRGKAAPEPASRAVPELKPASESRPVHVPAPPAAPPVVVKKKNDVAGF
jgi:eukaryotic-like serine/threonine-protein kinase